MLDIMHSPKKASHTVEAQDIKSINDIQQAHEAKRLLSSSFFYEKTLKAFRSIVEYGPGVIKGTGGIFFIVSSKQGKGIPREYAVCKFYPEGCGINHWSSWDTLKQAQKEAERLANLPE